MIEDWTDSIYTLTRLINQNQELLQYVLSTATGLSSVQLDVVKELASGGSASEWLDTAHPVNDSHPATSHQPLTTTSGLIPSFYLLISINN